MKFTGIALLLASAIQVSLGAAVAIAQTAVEAKAGLYIRPYKEIKCRPSDENNNAPAELHVTRRYNIPYLDGVEPCDLKPGPDGCGRISCSWNAGVHLCQRNITQPIAFNCYEAAEWARQIVNKCGNNQLVMGAAYDEEEDFSVEIFFSKC